MPVQITINGADATESIRELTTLAAAISGQATAVQPAEEPQKQKTETKQQRTTKPEQGSKPEPDTADKSEPETSGSSSDVPEDQGGEQEEIPTIVQLREVASAKGKTAEGKASIKALLTKYESKSISDVPEAKRAAFLRELEAL